MSRINRQLLPVKLAYFFYYYSLSSFMPYLPVFLRQAGLDAQQAGLVSGTRPMLMLASGLFWGMVGDRTGKHKLVVSTLTVIFAALVFLAPWLPTLMLSAHGRCDVNCTVLVTSSNKANITEMFHTNASQAAHFSNGSSTDSLYLHLTEDKNDKNMLFTAMMCLFIVASLFQGSTPAFIDTAFRDIAMRSKSNPQFGRQRSWGSVAFGLASISTGAGVELTGSHDTPNYHVAFYIFIASVGCLMVTIQFLFVKDKEQQKPAPAQAPSHGFWGDMRLIFCRFEVIFLFSTVFVMGFSLGLIYQFSFWYIKDLGGSEVLMGVSLLVMCFAEAATFPVAQWVIGKIGSYKRVIVIGLWCYTARYIIMSFLINPWLILPLNLFHCFSYAVFWSAIVKEVTLLGTNTTKSTMFAMLNCLHFGLGMGTAGYLGGVIYQLHGGRWLFRYTAILCLFWSGLVIATMFVKKEKNDKIDKLFIEKLLHAKETNV